MKMSYQPAKTWLQNTNPLSHHFFMAPACTPALYHSHVILSVSFVWKYDITSVQCPFFLLHICIVVMAMVMTRENLHYTQFPRVSRGSGW